MPLSSRADLDSRIPKIIVELQPLVDAAAKVGAEMVAADAKERVPVRTGALRDAIHVSNEGEGDWAVVAGNDDAWYGHIVEHGSAFAPAHPFLRPAMESKKREIVTLINKALDQL